MALSRTDLLQQISNTTGIFGTGNFTTSSFTPPNNSYLVVAVTIVENNGTTTDPRSSMTISGGGWSYTTAIDEVSSPTSFPTATRISKAVVGTGASMTLTLGTGGRIITAYCVTVHAYSGYDTVTPAGATGHFQQSGGFTGPPDAVSLTLSGSPLATSEVIAALGMDKAVVGATPGVGWTEVYDNMQNTSDDVGLEVEIRTGSTSTSVTWQDARSGGGALFNLAAVAFEVRAGGSVEGNWPSSIPQYILLDMVGRQQNAQGQSSVVTPFDSSLSATTTITPVAATTKPVDASLTAAVTITATASVVKPVDATLTITGSRTSTASLVKPVDATLTVTDTISPSFVSTKPVDASLTVTATVSPTGLTIKPVDATLNNVATITPAMVTTKPVDATLNAVATITVGASVGGVDASKVFTATITPAVVLTKPIDSALPAVATIASAASLVKPVDVSLNPSVTITATASVVKAVSAVLNITATITASGTSGVSGVPPAPRIINSTTLGKVTSSTSRDRAVSKTGIERQT